MSSSETYPPGYLEQYRGRLLVNVATAFTVLNVVFLALRFYARRISKVSLRWDDWILIPAFIFNIAVIAMCYVTVADAGVGRHLPYVLMYPEKIELYYKLTVIAIPCIYAVSMTLPKISILGLYLHVFRDKISRVVIYALFAGLILNVIIMEPILIAKCHPISYGWKEFLGEKIPGDWCAPLQPRLVWGTFFNIISDFVMLILPIPLIWHLQTTHVTKLGLAITFAMGSSGIVTSILRFAFFFDTSVLEDATWAAAELNSWVIIEPGIYMMAACTLAFAPLVHKALQGVSEVSSKLSLWRSHSGTLRKNDPEKQLEGRNSTEQRYQGRLERFLLQSGNTEVADSRLTATRSPGAAANGDGSSHDASSHSESKEEVHPHDSLR